MSIRVSFVNVLVLLVICTQFLTQYLHYQLIELACSQNIIVFVMYYALNRGVSIAFDAYVTQVSIISNAINTFG